MSEEQDPGQEPEQQESNEDLELPEQVAEDVKAGGGGNWGGVLDKFKPSKI